MAGTQANAVQRDHFHRGTDICVTVPGLATPTAAVDGACGSCAAHVSTVRNAVSSEKTRKRMNSPLKTETGGKGGIG